MSDRRSTGEQQSPGTHDYRRTVIIAVFIVLLVLGASLRALSGHGIVLTALIYAPSEKIRYPGSRTPGDTAVSFYLSLDSGDYERAYSLVLEPRWTEEPASYGDAIAAGNAPFRGWTGEQEFVRRLNSEIGIKGSGIKLNAVHARVVEELEPGVYARVFDIEGVRSAYRVKAGGNILGACSIFSWNRELVVLQVGRNYRVLLDGTKEAGSFYYQSWFTGLERIGDLR